MFPLHLPVCRQEQQVKAGGILYHISARRVTRAQVLVTVVAVPSSRAQQLGLLSRDIRLRSVLSTPACGDLHVCPTPSVPSPSQVSAGGLLLHGGQNRIEEW